MNKRKQITHYSLLIIILLATWLRLWQLPTTPPGLWFDESFNGMEAIWMRYSGNWPIFILGGQGREVLFHYILALSVAILGPTSYALRIVPVLFGILAIPLMSQWSRLVIRELHRQQPNLPRHALVLFSTGGLAVCFWYVAMNRISYRANTMLPFILLTMYLFWRGRQTGQWRYFLAAGGALGVCQYSYLAARLVPLIFVLFVLGETLWAWGTRKNAKISRPFPFIFAPSRSWLQLGLMLTVAFIIVTPMLWFFSQHPESSIERGSDVAFKVEWSAQGMGALAWHILDSIRLFIDGEDPNWRHHIVGQAGLDWLSQLGFWVGLIVTIRGYRQAINRFLLISLFVMWLPSLLSEPAFHTLRLSGILPTYYILVALGWWQISVWGTRRIENGTRSSEKGTRNIEKIITAKEPFFFVFFAFFAASRSVFALILVLFLSINTATTSYTYFTRWGNSAEVYQAYDGPLVELAELFNRPEQNIVIPFYLYKHATIRYGLWAHYHETVFMPPEIAAQLAQAKQTHLIMPTYPAAETQSPAWVWLYHGQAYVSAVSQLPLHLGEGRGEVTSVGQVSNSVATPLTDRFGQVMAQQYDISPHELLPLFPATMPIKSAAAIWADDLELVGYGSQLPETSPLPSPNRRGSQPWQLELTWRILGYKGLSGKLFWQLLDAQGQAVGQAELNPISAKIYRWRPEGLILQQLTMPALPGPGLYWIRLGYFDPITGQRLPIHSPTQQPLGDEVILGPFYAQTPQPDHVQLAQWGNMMKLLGYGLTKNNDKLLVSLYWQTIAPPDKDYTIFVQLLDKQHQVMAQQDKQPFNGLFPTSRWQVGDILVDQFELTIPPLGEGQGEVSKLPLLLGEGRGEVSKGLPLLLGEGRGEVSKLPLLLGEGRGEVLVTGMYDLATGERLTVSDEQGKLWPNQLVPLGQGSHE